MFAQDQQSRRRIYGPDRREREMHGGKASDEFVLARRNTQRGKSEPRDALIKLHGPS